MSAVFRHFCFIAALWSGVFQSYVCRANLKDSVALQNYGKALSGCASQSQLIDTIIYYANLLAYGSETKDTARAMAQLAIQYSDAIGYGRGMMQGCIILGNSYNIFNNSQKAIYYFSKGLKLAEKERATFFQEILYGNLAGVYQATDQYERSFTYYLSAIEAIRRSFSLSELPGKAYTVCVTYHNMALVLTQLYNYEQALHYAILSEKIAAWAGFPALLSHARSAKAEILMQMGRKEEARNLCELILREDKSRDASISVGFLLGDLCVKENDLVCALSQYRKVYAMSAFALDKLQAVCSLASVFYVLAEIDSAEQYAKQGTMLALDYNARKPLADMYTILAGLNEQRRNYRAASKYYHLQKPLADSLGNIKKNRLVFTLEMKYRTAEKDRHLAVNKLVIARQQASLVKQRLWTSIISSVAILLVASILFYHFHTGRVHKQRLSFLSQQEKAKSLLAMTQGEEKERKRIASDLHDGIGGLLSMVKMYFAKVQKKQPILTADDEFIEGIHLLDQCLSEVRKTAHNLMPELLLQHGLPEAIRIFCNNIQRLRQIKVNFQYYGFIDRLNPNFELFVYRVVQELIQNALKHSQANSVLLQLSLQENILNLTVEDDGIGFIENHLNKGSGLASIKNRVRALNGEIDIITGPDKGTSIIIEFDLQRQEILTHEN